MSADRSRSPRHGIHSCGSATGLAHAQAVIETWRREYNEQRPKKSVGGLTRALYAPKLAAARSIVTAGL